MKKISPIDTIVMKGKVGIKSLGGSLLSRSVRHNLTDSSKWIHTYPIKNTYYRTNEILVPELIKTQTYDGRITIHTHKNFTTEYGYSIYMSLPSRIYYTMTLPATQISQKQIESINNTPLYLEIKIPSLSGLYDMESFNDWITSKADYDKITPNSKSSILWNYIKYHHDFDQYGIEEYESKKPLKIDSLPLTQIDFALNIKGRLVKDIMELIGMTGYYARKNMRVWNNTTPADSEGDVVYKSPNGIEFRKGKKSSEIYKFYDKTLQKGNQYYDAVYTTQDFVVKSAAERLVKYNRDQPTELLRYEVSLRKVPSQRNAINKTYSKTTGEYKEINMFDVLDSTIYSRVPNKVMSDGLLNIFGAEIIKEMTNLLSKEKTMTDTDVIKDYQSKGLKYLGIKYLLDKGMTNDELWPYLVKTCGMSYEVARRMRVELKEEGVINKWNDGHDRTMDTLRGVYSDLT
mgnify:CR=1 FL=1|tara:strand:- start:4870 stop:6246 length:1377 start_codon:yes stop_codon:yes gene_type:complete